MRRLAILFVVIAMLAPWHLVTGKPFARVASKIARTAGRMRRFLNRQVKLLPRYGGAMGLIHN